MTELQENTLQISALLQGQGNFYNPSELFILAKNLPKSSTLDSIKVILYAANDYSNRHSCKIKEIIGNSIIVVVIPTISKFQIILAFEQNDKEYNSNFVEYIEKRHNIFYSTNDFNIALMEMKNICNNLKDDAEKRNTAIESLNQSYNSQIENGNSIFHDAIEYGKFHDIISIAEQTSDLIPEARNDFGETVLHFACRLNEPAHIRTLMELGCSPSKQDRSKSTALHLAIKYEANKIMEVFLEILTKNEKFEDQIVKALKVYNLEGYTPLHLAVLNNQKDVVIAIIRYCKAQNILDVCRMEVLGGGARILHLASSKNHNELYEAIVQEMPESIYLTDYAGRPSKVVEQPKVIRMRHHHTKANDPYSKGNRHKIKANSGNINHKISVEQKFSTLHIYENKNEINQFQVHK